MQRLLLCAVLAPLACFEDLGPTGEGDDVGDSGESTGSTGESTSDDTESSESVSTEGPEGTVGDDPVGDDPFDTSTGGIVGVYEPCGEDLTCQSGGTCIQIVEGDFVYGICLPTGCDGDPVGCPLGPPQSDILCENDLCMLGCASDDQCGMGMRCMQDGYCYFNVNYGPCPDPASCPLNTACVDSTNTCAPFCNGDDAECQGTGPATEYMCLDGGCGIICPNNWCPQPMVCDANQNCVNP